MNQTTKDWICALLADRGPMQSFAIMAARPDAFTFRQVDGALQSLRRAGRIRVLKRERGVRPFPLWELVA